MKLRRKSWFGLLPATLCLYGVVAAGPCVYGQSSVGFLDWLSTEMLQDVGVHLPSYVLSVQAQIAYQSKVPLHQEITVKWSGDAGGEQSTGSRFILAKRWQHLQKSASMSQLNPNDRPILVIATTPGGEVRALALCVDSRSTTAQLDVQLPQDGQISRLMFLNVVAGTGLERIGEVEVGSPEGAPQQPVRK